MGTEWGEASKTVALSSTDLSPQVGVVTKTVIYKYVLQR